MTMARFWPKSAILAPTVRQEIALVATNVVTVGKLLMAGHDANYIRRSFT